MEDEEIEQRLKEVEAEIDATTLDVQRIFSGQPSSDGYAVQGNGSQRRSGTSRISNQAAKNSSSSGKRLRSPAAQRNISESVFPVHSIPVPSMARALAHGNINSTRSKKELYCADRDSGRAHLPSSPATCFRESDDPRDTSYFQSDDRRYSKLQPGTTIAEKTSFPLSTAQTTDSVLHTEQPVCPTTKHYSVTVSKQEPAEDKMSTEEAGLREQLHQMDVERLRSLEKLKEELKEERQIRNEERQRTSQRESEMLTKINQLNSEKKSMQHELEEAVQELNISSGRIERLKQAQHTLEAQAQDLQTRISLVTFERDESQKKIHFEIGNSSRLECDLDHARNQLLHLGKEQKLLESHNAELRQANEAIRSEFTQTTTALRDTHEKLSKTSNEQLKLQYDFDRLADELNVAKFKLAEWRDLADAKKESESEQVALIDDLKQREHRLKTEVKVYKEQLSDKEELQHELLKLKKEYGLLGKQVSTYEEELTRLRNEVQNIGGEKVKAEISHKQAANDLLAAKQEIHSLRRQIQSLGGREGIFGIVGTGVQKECRVMERTETPSTHVSRFYGTKEVEKQDDMSYHKSKAPNMPVNDSSGVMSALRGESEPSVATKKQNPRVLCHEQRSYLEGLEKQLMLLQLEKTQIESNLNRFPASTRGRTLRERALITDNENRLSEVEVGIHKTRQELRQLGVR